MNQISKYNYNFKCTNIGEDFESNIKKQSDINFNINNKYNDLKIKLSENNEAMIKKYENEVLNKVNETSRYLVSELTILTGNKNLLLCIVDPDNKIWIWKNVEEMEKDIGFYSNIHIDRIKNIVINYSDDILFSSGEYDKTIIEWKIREVPNFYKVINNVKNNQSKIQIINEDYIKSNVISLYTKFCHFDPRLFCAQNTYIDSRCLIKGFTSNFMNKLFSKKLSSFERKKQYTPSQINLAIEYIFSSHAVDILNSVKYLHNYNIQDNQDLKSDNNFTGESSFIGNIENLLIKKINDDNYDYNIDNKNDLYLHKNCKKSIVYFNGRFVLIFDDEKGTQRIFQKHSNKITALSIHPNKPIIASSEVLKIGCMTLIWNTINFEVIKSIFNEEPCSVFKLEFSIFGNFLYCLFQSSNNYSDIINEQIFEKKENINKNKVLYYIKIYNQNLDFIEDNPLKITLSDNPIMGLKCFPNNEFIFMCYGHRRVIIIQYQITHFSILKEIDYTNLLFDNISKNYYYPSFICVDFFETNKSSTYSIISYLGDSEGNIFVLNNDSFYIIKEKAHKSEINCLKLITSNYFGENINLDEDILSSFIIITAGEDSDIKIWDKNLNLIKVWSIYSIYKFRLEDDFARVRLILLV